MINIGRRLATYLINHWDKLGRLKRWTIRQFVGSGIASCVSKGLSAIVKYLKKFTSDILSHLASFLGL